MNGEIKGPHPQKDVRAGRYFIADIADITT